MAKVGGVLRNARDGQLLDSRGFCGEGEGAETTAYLKSELSSAMTL